VSGMSRINFPRLATRRWIFLVVGVLAVEWLLVLGPLAFPVTEADALRAWARANDLLGWQIRQPLVVQILLTFGNNLKAALTFFVPVLGWIAFPWSVLGTGQLGAGLAAYHGITGTAQALRVILKADAWLELTAYACAFVEGFYLVYYLSKKRPKEDFWRVVTALILVVIALSVAAIAENVSIASGVFGPEVSLGIVVGGLVGIYAFIRRVWPESLQR
jgi:hypothetical protein